MMEGVSRWRRSPGIPSAWGTCRSGPRRSRPPCKSRAARGAGRRSASPGSRCKRGMRFMPEGHTIRVMLVDDHAMVRSGLTGLLMVYDDLELAGDASSGESAIGECDRSEPDVILMDLVMPGMSGAEATRRIRERHPATQVIALTSFKEDELVQGALAAGAIGYLLKNVTADELAEAIRAAYQGKPTLAPEAAQALIRATTQPPEIGP